MNLVLIFVLYDSRVKNITSYNFVVFKIHLNEQYFYNIICYGHKRVLGVLEIFYNSIKYLSLKTQQRILHGYISCIVLFLCFYVSILYTQPIN